MKIAYFDLNYPDCIESYSVSPKAYGGGRIAATALRESSLVDCHIYADEKSFLDCFEEEKKQNNHTLNWPKREAIRNGAFVELKKHGYDLLVHHNSNLFVQTDVPQVIWCLGYGDAVEPRHKHVMLYNELQNPRLTSSIKPNIHKIIIGVDVPDLHEKNKQECFLFQCTRHTPYFGSIEIAKYCLDNNQKIYFAGPIDKGYPLLDFINNKETFYLGLISEEDKVKYTSEAIATTYLHTWPTPFNLSACSSWACGTPLIAAKTGFFPSFITHGKNGYLLNSFNNEEIKKAIETCRNISPFDCWSSVLEYSTAKMVDTFVLAFYNVLESESTEFNN